MYVYTPLFPQTGSEASVERLMKQIGSFMSEISDEFKTIVVEAIRSVCVKFPRKHHILMTFLSSMLREEGGFEYKTAIVDTIITIIDENPEAKEAGEEWRGRETWGVVEREGKERSEGGRDCGRLWRERGRRDLREGGTVGGHGERGEGEI